MSKVSSSLLSGGVGNGRGAGGVAEGGDWGRGGGNNVILLVNKMLYRASCLCAIVMYI